MGRWYDSKQISKEGLKFLFRIIIVGFAYVGISILIVKFLQIFYKII